MNLFKAHRQWASRPADERFATLADLHSATKAYASTAAESRRQNADLRVEVIDGDVQLIGKSGAPAKLTHWAFGQLSQRVGAPPAYLRGLPATLATQNLNHGLKAIDQEADAQLLFHMNGSLLLRAITSDKYSRIWNHEVADRLLDMAARGWEPAIPDMNAFNGAEPSLYASDHDMFVFLRSANTTINEPGSDRPIWRGVIVENSEVGAGALKFTRFMYRAMCGNHIIWGASKVMEVSFRHVGSVQERWGAFQTTVRSWSDASESEERGIIERAQSRMIAATKDEVLDALFGKPQLKLSRKTLEAGYDAVKQDQDGDPRTVWGIVQGLTRHSQTLPFADTRTELDRAAGKILTIDF